MEKNDFSSSISAKISAIEAVKKISNLPGVVGSVLYRKLRKAK
ncbi:MAG: hypothetical protein P4L51_17755 [Puia sp.]|nr:hypothetical protein [Puia sp.]